MPAEAAIIDLAEALTSALSGNTWTNGSATFTRMHVPVLDLADVTSTPTCFVVPVGIDVTGATRAGSYHDYQIDVSFHMKPSDAEGDDAIESVDAAHAFVEEIADFIRHQNITGASSEVFPWKTLTVTAIADQDHLREHGIVSAVLSVTYQRLR